MNVFPYFMTEFTEDDLLSDLEAEMQEYVQCAFCPDFEPVYYCCMHMFWDGKEAKCPFTAGVLCSVVCKSNSRVPFRDPAQGVPCPGAE